MSQRQKPIAVIEDNIILDDDYLYRRLIAYNPKSKKDINIEISQRGVIRIADSGIRYQGDGLSAYSEKLLHSRMTDYTTLYPQKFYAGIEYMYLLAKWNVGDMRRATMSTTKSTTTSTAQVMHNIDTENYLPVLERNLNRGYAHVLVGTINPLEEEIWEQVRMKIKSLAKIQKDVFYNKFQHSLLVP